MTGSVTQTSLSFRKVRGSVTMLVETSKLRSIASLLSLLATTTLVPSTTMPATVSSFSLPKWVVNSALGVPAMSVAKAVR